MNLKGVTLSEILAMVILFLASVLFIALPFAIHAAHIVSDPYPKTGAYPDFCVMKETGKSDVVSPVASDATSTWCNIDVSGIPSGTHSTNVLARSTIWGDSPAVPFAFSAGPPAGPAHLLITAP